MQISNLTESQVEMLNFMWNELDSYEEFMEWMETLDPVERKDAELLQRLVLIEAAEEMLEQTNYRDANRVIDQFRLTK
jgi:hypothetical protein